MKHEGREKGRPHIAPLCGWVMVWLAILVGFVSFLNIFIDFQVTSERQLSDVMGAVRMVVYWVAFGVLLALGVLYMSDHRYLRELRLILLDEQRPLDTMGRGVVYMILPLMLYVGPLKSGDVWTLWQALLTAASIAVSVVGIAFLFRAANGLKEKGHSGGDAKKEESQ